MQVELSSSTFLQKVKVVLRFVLIPLLALLAIQATRAFGANDPVTVLPLGDSITQAESLNADNYNSYRRALWQLLQANGYTNVDFVGSWDVAYPNQSTPDPDFDMDHEGHWGWYAEELINGCGGCPPNSGSGNLATWLQGYTPDIVLLHIGSNDLKDSGSDADIVNQTLDEIGQIIDILRGDNPDVTILLAQLIPSTRTPRDRRVPLLNAEIPNLAANKTQPNSPVIVVDQFTGFSATDDSYDGTHPNESGETKMAQRWFDALVPLLGGAPPATNTPIPPTATHTAVSPTATNTYQPTETNTPLPAATNTPQPTATNTPVPPTATNTPQPTATNTAVPPTPTAMPVAPRCSGSHILFVGETRPLPARDQVLVDRLVGQGHTVDIRHQYEASGVDASGKDLVIISDSLNSRNIENEFGPVAVPVITWEAGLYWDMKLTGTAAWSDYGYENSQSQIDIVNSNHPLAAGLTNGVVTPLDVSSRFFYGRPSADAAVIATMRSSSNRSAIFAYEAGDTMVGMTAPARRVAFFNGDGLDYNAQAWQLFDAAITWGLGCDEMAVSTATPTNTPQPTATNTPVPPTTTNTPQPTATNMAVPTHTATNTPIPPTATHTAVSPTATNTPQPTATNTPVPPTATNTPQPTATNTPVPPTTTNTPQPTATNMAVPTHTATHTAVSPTATNTYQPTETNTPLPAATNTPQPTATNTPVPPTATNTPQPTATNTAVPPTPTAMPVAPRCSGSHILFVGETRPLPARDQVLVDRLVGQGHTVDIRHQYEASGVDASGKDLVIISDSLNSRNIENEFGPVAVPVITWEAGLYWDMKLTGTAAWSDYGYENSQSQIDIVNSNHPLAAGLTNGVVTPLDVSSRFFYGRPSADAAVIATMRSSSNRSAIFAYEAGDTMVGMTAPARRVAFFNGDGLDYNAQAWQLFDAAITWGLGCDEMAVSTATPTNTPQPTATNTPVPPTTTNTPQPTATNMAVPTHTATNTPIPPTATHTAVSPTATNTPQPTATNTPVPPTATNTPQPTATNTPVPPTTTNTPQPTATNMAVPTHTATHTAVSPTATNTYQPTETNTPLPAVTNTPQPTATNTPVPPTATNTPQPTATNTAVPPTPTAMPVAPRCSGSHILFVGETRPLPARDQVLVDRLVGQGHTVDIRHQYEASGVDASGKDLVIISDSLNSRNIENEFGPVAVPVITWEAGLYWDMKLTGTAAWSDYGYENSQSQIDIVNSNHPLAAGLTNGVVTPLDVSSRFFYGRPSADAAVIATMRSSSNRSAIFAYEAGDTMVGMTAPARRVAFFNGDGLDYNAQAWQLYDAAITWGLGCESVNTVSSEDNNWWSFMTLLWSAAEE